VQLRVTEVKKRKGHDSEIANLKSNDSCRLIKLTPVKMFNRMSSYKCTLMRKVIGVLGTHGLMARAKRNFSAFRLDFPFSLDCLSVESRAFIFSQILLKQES
jgi:hypothetical protein